MIEVDYKPKSLAQALWDWDPFQSGGCYGRLCWDFWASYVFVGVT